MSGTLSGESGKRCITPYTIGYNTGNGKGHVARRAVTRADHGG